MSIILISHDPGVIAELCDFVYVMYAGRIVEQAEVCELFDNPMHPYTRGLLRSVSALERGGERLDTIPGVVPNLLRLPAGCAFSLRCGECSEDCAARLPELVSVNGTHLVRCHMAGGENRGQ
jgi:peptide/nickel transport system ATP-binding protein